jgi:hypothetical protein
MYFLIFFSVYFFYIVSIFTANCSFTENFTKILHEIKSNIKLNNAISPIGKDFSSSFKTSKREKILVQALFLVNRNYQTDVDSKHFEFTKTIQLNFANRLMQKFEIVELGIANYRNWLSLQDSDSSCYSLSLPLTRDFNTFKKHLEYIPYYSVSDKAESSLMTLKYAAEDSDVKWKSRITEYSEEGFIYKTLKLIFIFPAFAPVLNKPFSHLIKYGNILIKDPVCKCRIEDMPSPLSVNEILNRQNIIPIIVVNDHYRIDEYWNKVMNDLAGLKLSIGEANSEQLLLDNVEYLIKNFENGRLDYTGTTMYKKFSGANVVKKFKKSNWEQPVYYNLCSERRVGDTSFKYKAICAANSYNWSEPSCSGILCIKTEIVERRNPFSESNSTYHYVRLNASDLSDQVLSVDEVNESLLSCRTLPKGMTFISIKCLKDVLVTEFSSHIINVSACKSVGSIK